MSGLGHEGAPSPRNAAPVAPRAGAPGRAGAARREREEELRALADALPQPAWIADDAGLIARYNARWHQYTGRTPEQMAGAGWRSAYAPAWLPRMLRHWRRALRDGQPFEMAFPIRAADGQFR